jgi:hypothetical protein
VRKLQLKIADCTTLGAQDRSFIRQVPDYFSP